MTDITADDEREARLWLAHAENRLKQNSGKYKYVENDDFRHRATILALLDRPRTTMPRPEDVPDSVLDAMWAKVRDDCHSQRAMRNVYGVVRDWRSQPAEPRKVEAWGIAAPNGEIIHVRQTEDAARQRAKHCPDDVRLVRLVEADHD